MKTLSKLALALVSVAVWGCKEPAPPPIQQEAPPAAVIKRFTASPTEVSAGDKTVISWEVENATAVSIEQLGVGAVPGVASSQKTGEIDVTVEQDALFLLTAHGEGGIDQQAAAVYTLGKASSVLLTSVPSRIESGEATTLVWSAPGATSLSLEDADGTPLDMGSTQSTGTLQVRPERTTRYLLRAGNRTVTAEVQVVGALKAFTISDGPHLPGTELTLSWTTGAADAVSLAVEGRGAIYTAPDAASVKQGSVIDSIPSTQPLNSVIVYTLTVETAGKSITRSLVVNVGADPEIKTFTVPDYAKRGDGFGVTVGWDVRGADVVDVFFDDVHVYEATLPSEIREGRIQGYQPPAGKEELVVRLEARNGKGGFSKLEKTVDLVGAPQVHATDGFTAAPIPVGGTEPLTLSWSIKDARNLVIRNKDNLIVARKSGLDAEDGSYVTHINRDEEYVLTADNTLGDSVSLTLPVTVNEIFLNSPGNGIVVQGGTVELRLDAAPADTAIYRTSFEGFTRTSPSTNFVDISTTGTSVALVATGTTYPATDDGLGKFTTDFTTRMFGEELSATNGVTVSSNGWITFGDAGNDSRPYSYSLPRAGLPEYFIAPYWEDLIRRPAGGLHWQVIGTAPYRTLIVQWTKHYTEYYDWYYGGTYILDLDAQVQITEEGDVSFHYTNLAGSTSYVYPSAGIQGVDNTEFAKAGTSVSATSGIHNNVEYWFGKKRLPLPATVVVNSKDPILYAVQRGSEYPLVSYVVPTFLAPNDLFISEVMYAPAAPHTQTGEYVEIENRTTQALDLDGFTLTLGTGKDVTISSANGPTAIGPGELLVFGQSTSSTANGGATVHHAWGATAMDDTAAAVTLTKNGGLSSTLNYNRTLGIGDLGVSVTHDFGQFITSSTSTSLSSRTCNTPVARTYGPGGRGTPGSWTGCAAYRAVRIAKPFKSIALTGTPLFLSDSGDNEVRTLALGLPYPYFGVTPGTNSTVQVGVNGFLTFDTGTISTIYANAEVRPLVGVPNSVVAPFGDDLRIKPSEVLSNVFVQRIAADEDPEEPEAHWVFQWNDLKYDSTSYDNSITVQAKLFDSGRIEFHYGELTQTLGSLAYHLGYSANAWLENSTGTEAIAIRTAGQNAVNLLSPSSGYVFLPVTP